MIRKKAYLLLDDGFTVQGNLVGKPGTAGGEICFNTGMTGYQEIYTDPSYYGQIIVNTAAHIGNYGALDDEQESDSPKIAGIVVNDFTENYSRKTATEGLQKYLERNNITGLADVDTRMIVRHIRDKGAMNALISSELSVEEMKKELARVPPMQGLELSSVVSTREPYLAGDETAPFRVAVLDLGIKRSILKNLVSRGCYCKVFPARTTFKEMEEWNPQGYFVSNGPGDPSVMDYAITTTREILDSRRPLFGICLGHQLLALACGISTYKMHNGHRGLNHPVKNLLTGKGEMTSQNHGFAVSEEDIKKREDIAVTHVHLNDKTIMGISVKNKKAFSVQYHPEASPGPHDSRYLFDQFLANVKEAASVTA